MTAAESPLMVKHREGEISEAPVSELYSSRMLRQWEDSLQYLLSKLRNVWNSYAGLMQNRISEFYIVLLSAVFVYMPGVRNQRNPEQELGILIIHEDKKAEVKAEERLNVFLEVDEVSDLRLEDEDLLREAEGDTKRKKDAVALGRIKRQKEDEIRPERSLHLPSASRRAHDPERFYSEDWNEVQQEGEEWQLPDDLRRILKMVFRSRDI